MTGSVRNPDSTVKWRRDRGGSLRSTSGRYVHVCMSLPFPHKQERGKKKKTAERCQFQVLKENYKCFCLQKKLMAILKEIQVIQINLTKSYSHLTTELGLGSSLIAIFFGQCFLIFHILG